MKAITRRMINMMTDGNKENERTLKIIYEVLKRRAVINDSEDDRVYLRSQLDEIMDTANERQARLILTFAKGLCGKGE